MVCETQKLRSQAELKCVGWFKIAIELPTNNSENKFVELIFISTSEFIYKLSLKTQ